MSGCVGVIAQGDDVVVIHDSSDSSHDSNSNAGQEFVSVVEILLAA